MKFILTLDMGKNAFPEYIWVRTPFLNMESFPKTYGKERLYLRKERRGISLKKYS
jgi:hypothetical protein